MTFKEELHALVDHNGFVAIDLHRPIQAVGQQWVRLVGAVTRVVTSDEFVCTGGGSVSMAVAPRGEFEVVIHIDNIKKVTKQ